MLNQLFPLHSERIFGPLLLVIERNDILGDIAQFIIGEDIIQIGHLLFLGCPGKIPQFRDGFADTRGKAGEHEEENQSHHPHKIDKIHVYLERTFHLRIILQG